MGLPCGGLIDNRGCAFMKMTIVRHLAGHINYMCAWGISVSFFSRKAGNLALGFPWHSKFTCFARENNLFCPRKQLVLPMNLTYFSHGNNLFCPGKQVRGVPRVIYS